MEWCLHFIVRLLETGLRNEGSQKIIADFLHLMELLVPELPLCVGHSSKLMRQFGALTSMLMQLIVEGKVMWNLFEIPPSIAV